MARGDAGRGPSTLLGRVGVRAAVAAIHAYRLAIAPTLGGACRFEPSCSAYASEAIERHGLWRGMALGLRRLARCRPFGPAGYDPVPGEVARGA